MIHHKLFIATAIVVSGVILACSDTAAPNQLATNGSRSEASRKRGALHLTKECSEYTALAGGFCTITKSNLKEITVGTREFALKDADLVAGTLNSDGLLYVRDGELALNHCDIFGFFATKGVIGSCTFSGGIGHLSGFRAQVVVSVNKDDPNKADFDGTYSFSDRD
ncbi:MAG TPA: hypothetical protein VGN76_09690 [Gemmatimonadales bacterium]|jgi:ABC-type amino acid transport substrate-binding protein|nr:hypothetical protein [Gemmatimonadales bacterium]